jgi:cytochrome c-type biogenesis protein CcmH/NrfF
MREIRCVVCQNESIGESDADIATNLKNIAREHLAA